MSGQPLALQLDVQQRDSQGRIVIPLSAVSAKFEVGARVIVKDNSPSAAPAVGAAELRAEGVLELQDGRWFVRVGTMRVDG